MAKKKGTYKIGIHKDFRKMYESGTITREQYFGLMNKLMRSISPSRRKK